MDISIKDKKELIKHLLAVAELSVPIDRMVAPVLATLVAAIQTDTTEKLADACADFAQLQIEMIAEEAAENVDDTDDTDDTDTIN